VNAPAAPPSFLARSRLPLWLAGWVLGLAFSLASVPNNPLGFFIDESSIAYNAYTISRSGSDEYGVRWPLYFRAFDEYKNPTYIYLLAGLFKVFGPSIWLARLLSAIVGLSAAVLLGILAGRMTGQDRVGVIVALTALVTPWLFEISRLVFEVALFPLTLVLFLLALYRAQTRVVWTPLDTLWLASTLGLITYTYSTGRLLGSLLALGLLVFARRSRWTGILRTWIIYGVLLVPLLVFNQRHPGALTARFYEVSYIRPQSTLLEIAGEFLKNYLDNLSLRSLLVIGDVNVRHHVPGMGSMLAATVLLGVVGLVLVLWSRWRDPWWQFILYGLVVSVVPAALTAHPFHTLRLIAFPVFLLVLTVPALAWLVEGGKRLSAPRAAFSLLLVLTLLQAAVFQWQFYQEGPKRGYAFDAGFPEVFAAATVLQSRPMYLIAGPGRYTYIHAYWYGTLEGMDASEFVRLSAGERPPAQSLVIDDMFGEPCVRCQIILMRPPYVVYRAL
jgi:4-amino-4-deoxy-L-arabinose transferase-like glycosyltransferase